MTEPASAPPSTDVGYYADLIDASVAHVIGLAATWLAWDGRPYLGDGSAWTPHKALRRVTDHLLDHIAEIDAVLAGLESVPDTWHGRAVTTDADRAAFGELDLDEARSRLTRLALMYRARLSSLSFAELNEPRVGAWPIREIVEHVADVSWYADQVGDLSGSGPRQVEPDERV
jgi:hypothetical protein